MKDSIFRKVQKLNIWGMLALLALLLCIDIEFEFILIPCHSCKNAQAVNNIILSLSYSYIAAAIFHYFVNIIPYKKRKKSISPFLMTQLWSIKENLRLCKNEVFPMNLEYKKYKKDDFCELFSKTNLHENCYWSKGISKLDRLNDLRTKIVDTINVIFSYREYVNDNLFYFLNDMMNTPFIKDGINPYPDVENIDLSCYDSNQDVVGENIYKLYEETNKMVDEMSIQKC